MILKRVIIRHGIVDNFENMEKKDIVFRRVRKLSKCWFPCGNSENDDRCIYNESCTLIFTCSQVNSGKSQSSYVYIPTTACEV